MNGETANASLKIEASFTQWMATVLEQHAAASGGLEADPVHDLRVALRRCLQVAKVFEALDPDPGWAELRREGHRLFKRLGRLRDTQVLRDWVNRIDSGSGPVAQALKGILDHREREDRDRASKALARFSRRRWARWARDLAPRTAPLPAGSLAAEYLALERWEQAYALHRKATRSGSHAAFHRARIGIKKFRYTVENFLPQCSAPWMPQLKKMQDALGEVHDLDLLLGMLRSLSHVGTARERQRWRRAIIRLADARIRAYRRMSVRASAWRAWRKALPEGRNLEAAAMAWLEAWADFLTPDRRHARHVTALALELYDQLAAAGMGGAHGNGHTRRVLEIAALAHDVGRSRGARAHHKRSYRMISGIKTPLGWTPEEMHLAALVARYHRRALPGPRHTAFARLRPDRRQKVLLLAGILRLANAFDRRHDASVHSLKAEIEPGRISIRAGGYRSGEPQDSCIASARHLFEIATRRPVAVLSSPL